MQTLEDLGKVRAAMETWLDAFNTRNLDALISVYGPHSVYANAQSPLMRGPEQIQSWFKSAFELIEGRMRFQEEGHLLNGAMAVLYGKYFLESDCATSAGGNTGRVALVFEKDTAGDWKVVFDMDNTPPDALASDFL
ncbi:DUF4440 domain-containing protein [Roseibium denhamense]|uniref:Ketosteroid isomerase homolog n=1 Tax=Roseibium denhamense TaxID=76305 RepID=A0ABY1NT15_9HYPH|nr:DUF4440 domain-containing protein [Roseibium denhamense]MTI05367.1 DUF4440 domain-containing protein [Roseibium denhamense]SMP17383.1 Ketosteroid isomerase homolog [Roseibium denhamense]